jgi:hypothetical protein
MKNKFIVIENVLKKENFLTIKNILEERNFPWYFCPGVNHENDNDFQFVHTFYNNFTIISNFYDLIIPIIKVLKPIAIIKIKANLLTKEKNIIEHGMHVDYYNKKHANCKTAVYYVNTNNGYTKFLDGTKISSQENKLLIFNSEEKHTGTTCTDALRRIVINFNYVQEEL